MSNIEFVLALVDLVLWTAGERSVVQASKAWEKLSEEGRTKTKNLPPASDWPAFIADSKPWSWSLLLEPGGPLGWAVDNIMPDDIDEEKQAAIDKAREVVAVKAEQEQKEAAGGGGIGIAIGVGVVLLVGIGAAVALGKKKRRAA